MQFKIYHKKKTFNSLCKGGLDCWAGVVPCVIAVGSGSVLGAGFLDGIRFLNNTKTKKKNHYK